MVFNYPYKKAQIPYLDMHNLALTTSLTLSYKTSTLTQNWPVSWASGQFLWLITLGKLQSPVSVYPLLGWLPTSPHPTLCLVNIQLKSLYCKETFLNILLRIIQLRPFTARESNLLFSLPTLQHLCQLLGSFVRVCLMSGSPKSLQPP